MNTFELTREQLERPGAYIFWLGTVCQYVGQGKNCISRATGSGHHVKQVPGFTYDRIEFRFTETREKALELETELIQMLSPVFNKTYHPPGFATPLWSRQHGVKVPKYIEKQ
jgi:excinuclease UvrABC nuclease subunit